MPETNPLLANILSTISVDCVIFGYFENELTVLVRNSAGVEIAGQPRSS